MPMSAGLSEQDLEYLLDYLKRSRGFDFTGYKRASLSRRIQKRMQVIGVPGYSDYVDYLEVHPEEFAELFNTILINVTRFFRDDSAWGYLQKDVLPPILARKGQQGRVRAWSAGCASGEEAYTIAMILAETLGPEEYKERVKIYATDVDEEALAKARQAAYTEAEVEDVPKPLLEKYFDQYERQYVFKKEFRRQIIFGRHDLVQDSPISRIDVLACRNTLMYFNAETQSRILARFHFALNDDGILLLGRAETLMAHAATFSPVDLKRRISAKVPRGRLPFRERLLLMSQSGTEDAGNGISQQIRLREVAMDTAPVAQVVVDGAGVVVLANERARLLFGIALEDVGRPLQDLKLSYRPVELRSLIDRVAIERRSVLVRDVDFTTITSEPRSLDVHLVPMFDVSNGLLGIAISFMDVTAAKRLQLELEHTNRAHEASYEELQSTNEELETTNEELQSTVEELETTNEELQSTNEELETMNEELQSTNEELTTINDELRVRSDELNQVNAFLESILTSLRGGVVVVDNDLRVLAWSTRAQELWGLREEEALGKPLLSLDIGLPVERLKQAMMASLAGALAPGTEFTLDAINRRGKQIQCRVVIYQLLNATKQLRGLILVMDQLDGREPAAVIKLTRVRD